MAKVCRSLPDTTDAVVDFDEDTAIVEPGFTEKVASNQTFKGSTETGGTKN